MSNQTLFGGLLSALIAATLLGSCDGGDVISSPDQIAFPDSNVSFRAQVQPYLSLSCSVRGCHDAARVDNSFVSLTSWSGVRDVRVVNQPGDTNCGLVRVIYGRQIHAAPMVHIPTVSQQRGIKTWVLEGAKDN